MPVETLLPESPGSVEITASRLGVWRGEVPSMPRAHRHDDLEFNFVLDGALEYLFGGSRVRVESGQMALFWAATPHRLIAKDATPSDIFWLHIPLAKVLSWGLPNRNLNELLINQLIVVPAAAVERNLESMFKSWTSDLESCEGETIALLEAHAVTRRALQHHLQSSSGADENQTLPAATGDCMMRVTTMAQFMTAHFRQNISMSDIASSAHLSPNYAMTLFRDVVGTTLGNYLTRCRVAEAQRLLITTSMTTVAIAHAAGFGSQSSFYVDTDLMGKDVLIVEDIIDSGLTLSWLKTNLESRGTASVEICTAFRKPTAAKVEIDVKYVGFDIPNEFVVGYGLDYAEKYRNLDFVGTLAPHVYE